MRYCEGKPERGTRPLAAAERLVLGAALSRARTRHTLAVAFVAAPFVAVPLAGWAVTRLEVPAPLHPHVLTGSGVVVIALLVALPLAMLLARDAGRRVAALRRDLRRGEALTFGDGPEALVVLPGSAHVIARAGALGVERRPVLVGDAAPPVAEPVAYAVPASEVPDHLAGAAWSRRPLSADERSEIERHAARLGRLPWPLVLFSVVFAAAAAAGLSGGHAADAGPRAWTRWWPAVAWAVPLGIGWWRVLRGRRAAAALRGDVEAGWVFLEAGDPAGRELLPGTGAPWVEGGVPAEWRLGRPPR